MLETKLSSDQNLDLGLRSENIEFWKLPVAQNPSKMGTGNFRGSMFSLLRPESGFWSLGGFVLVPRAWLPGFGHLSREVREGMVFWVDFWGVAIGVRARGVVVCVFAIWGFNSFGWGIVFFRSVGGSWWLVFPYIRGGRGVEVDLGPRPP